MTAAGSANELKHKDNKVVEKSLIYTHIYIYHPRNMLIVNYLFFVNSYVPCSFLKNVTFVSEFTFKFRLLFFQYPRKVKYKTQNPVFE